MSFVSAHASYLPLFPFSFGLLLSQLHNDVFLGCDDGGWGLFWRVVIDALDSVSAGRVAVVVLLVVFDLGGVIGCERSKGRSLYSVKKK